jgi:hypothetical protein
VDIKRGQDRLVLVLPALKIAVKFPIIHLFLALRDFKHFSQEWGALKKYLMFPIETEAGLKGYLSRGVLSNWNEFWFYLKTRNPFLQPTYFSFFGFLNIQKCDEPCQSSDDNLWRQFIEIAGNSICQDPHHFYNHQNFCVYKNRLRMLDYGNRQVRDIITRHGTEIYEKFDVMIKP